MQHTTSTKNYNKIATGASFLSRGTVNQLIACCRVKSFTDFKNMLERQKFNFMHSIHAKQVH